jgi:hypothetical protein
MILDLEDEELAFLVDALNDTADVFGDDGEDFEHLVELVEAEANLRKSHLAMIDDAFSSYGDRHRENFDAAASALFESVADKIGAALGN